METIGFIGLGVMGRPMAKNLVKAGFTVIGYSPSAASREAAAKGGVIPAASVAELAPRCGVIIHMLPTPAVCLAVALGPGGVGENAKPGTLVLDMSSLSPMTAREIHKGLAAKGIAMMDAPVSGGEPKAIDGTLAVMLGGSKSDYERALPALNAMAASSILVGDVGAGSVAKLANQIIVAVNIAAVGEALTLAAKAGADPGLVFDAIRGGLAGSAVLEAKGAMMLARDYTPGARMEIHIKDLANVIETAHGAGSPVPLAAQVMEMMQALKANGMGQIDHGGLIRFFELLAKVEVKRGSP